MQICGCLSAQSLDRFARIYAYQRGKNLKDNEDISRWLLPRMRRQNKIWQLANFQFYTISPIIKPDRLTQDAFWVFLENFQKGASLQSLGQGPKPAQISFSRTVEDETRTYHIISVKGDGSIELMQAVQYERDMKQARKPKREKDKKFKYPEERFIILFKNENDMRNAAYRLEGRTMYGIVRYSNGNPVPEIRFYDANAIE